MTADRPDVGLDYVKIRHPSHALRHPNPLPPDFSGPVTLTLSGTTTVRVRVVDHQRRPLAGVPVLPQYVSRPDKGGSLAVSNSSWFHVRTDDEGIATFRTMPADLERPLDFFVDTPEHFPQERTAFDLQQPRAEIVAVQLPMVPVRGRVRFADGRDAAGASVRVASDSFHERNFQHHIQADERGRFDLKVYPDQYYLFVADSGEFASPPHVQVIRLEQDVEPLDVVLHPATHVHGRLTEGSRGRPAGGERVTLYQRDDGYAELPEDQRLPNPRESRKAILPEIGRGLKTDADGRFEVWVGPGSHSVAGPQTANRSQFEVPPRGAADAPAVVEVNLHANRPEKGRLTGRVVRHDDPDRGVSGPSIHGRATVREGTFVEATADDEGRFEADRARLSMLVAAFNEDRSLGAIVELDPDADTLELKIAPTASAVGQLLDARTGEPLAGQRIEGGVRIQLDPTTFTDAFGTHATTDENGWFVLTGLVVGWEYSLKLATEFEPLNDRPRAWQDIGKGTAEKAEQLELEPIRVRLLPRGVMQGARARGEFRPNQPLATRLETALRDARLASQRLLLLFGSPDTDVCRQFFEFRYDPDRRVLRTALSHYVLLPIDIVTPAQAEAAGALAERLRVTLPPSDGMTLAALDAGQRVVAQTTSRPLETGGRLDADRLAGFLARHAPDLPDAEELLGEALARARREDKRVLLQCTGAGEVLLARFLDDHRALMETDYVWLRIDMRFQRSDDVIRRLGRRGGSFPWMAILDARGTPLIDSIGPDGNNIGFPRDAAGIEHFGKMLRTTRLRLTDAEIETVLEALRER